MEQPPTGAFLPSRDGLAFTNSWPSAPGVCVRTPVGTIGIGNAARGLCGGMIFAALDYRNVNAAAPTAQPTPGSPFYRYIVRRLVDSWHIPHGVARYYLWMSGPDADASRQILGRRLPPRPGIARRTVELHWPRIKAIMDRGQPAVLGLVTVASASPVELGRNHQVLACGYRQAGSEVTVQVYDPNTGQDDAVFIAFDIAGAAAGATFAHNINIGLPVRGFFLTPYRPAVPPTA